MRKFPQSHGIKPRRELKACDSSSSSLKSSKQTLYPSPPQSLALPSVDCCHQCRYHINRYIDCFIKCSAKCQLPHCYQISCHYTFVATTIATSSSLHPSLPYLTIQAIRTTLPSFKHFATFPPKIPFKYQQNTFTYLYLPMHMFIHPHTHTHTHTHLLTNIYFTYKK